MARTVAIGIQDFDKVITNNYFYIDKTNFIKEWWESGDDVTLIARPRRFGKTLNLNMLDYFFPTAMLEEVTCLRGCLSGKKKYTDSCRVPIRSSACPLQVSKEIIIQIPRKEYVKC